MKPLTLEDIENVYGLPEGIAHHSDWDERLIHTARLAHKMREALEWCLDEICPHTKALEQLKNNPNISRAWCSCSSWVNEDWKNEAKQALALWEDDK